MRRLKPSDTSLRSQIVLVIFILTFAGLGSRLIFFSHAATSCTVTASSLNAIQTDVENAAAGSVVCVSAGSYGDVLVSGVTPTSMIYLQPVSGATVHFSSFSTDPSSGAVNNLTVQGFYIDGGIIAGGSSTGGLTFKYNTIENMPKNIAINLDAQIHGGSYTESGISILNNQIDHIGQCLNVGRGQSNVTFSNNVCGPGLGDGATVSTDPGHYIETGGLVGFTVDHNAFEGPADSNAQRAGLHLNVFHIFGDASNVDFSNNIIWHSDAIAQTVLIQEGQYNNITANNNVDVEDPACMPPSGSGCYTEAFEVYTPHGFSLKNNTFENTAIGLFLGPTCSNGCYATGNNMTVQNNIVEPSSSYSGNYSQWSCASACTADYNVSGDNTAIGTSPTINWTPKYVTTVWIPHAGEPYTAPPTGYYIQDDSSLPSTTGYQGGAGPNGGVGASALNGSGGTTTVTGDLNGDGHVNIFDLSILLSHWQQSGASLPEDFNNDGVVNIFDLSILLSHYGS